MTESPKRSSFYLYFLVRDKEFVAEQKLTEGADEVYVNGDSFIREARALESVPEQVKSAMGHLIDWYRKKEIEGEHPIIIAAT